MFAAVYAALYTAHSFGDHWVQTHRQACDKGAPGRVGAVACLGHVVSLTATKAAFQAAMQIVTGLELSLSAVYLALAVDAASHYWADRRYTLRALAERLGKSSFHQLSVPEAAPCGTGAYALDQSWHHAWLFVAALIIAGGVQ